MDDKLKKTLLLMLRSSMPGEVVAARDAMLRVAQSHHYGPHELTQAVMAVITARERGSGNAPPN